MTNETECADVDVAASDVIVVTSEPVSLAPVAVLHVLPTQATAIANASPSPAQPGQLWIVAGGMSEELRAAMARIEELGADVREADGPVELWRAIALHLQAEVVSHRHTHANLRRENTVLRRELNRALSVLGDRHPLLGLMPSATLDDIAAEHAYRADQGGAFSERWLQPTGEHVETEVRRLREEIIALHQTKLMRWSRPARSVYATLRGRRLPAAP